MSKRPSDVMQEEQLDLPDLTAEQRATMKHLLIALLAQRQIHQGKENWTAEISCTYGPGYLRINNYYQGWPHHEDPLILRANKGACPGETRLVLVALLALNALGYIEFRYEPIPNSCSGYLHIRFTNRAIHEMGGEV